MRCRIVLLSSVVSSDTTELNKKEEKRKKLELIEACGSETFRLLNMLLQPKTAKEATFDEILDVLDKYFEPQRSVTMSRFDFGSRKQKENESRSDYVKELKRLAIPCKFGSTFDERLRDQIVVGGRDGNLIKRLLSEPKLDSFQKAVDLASNTEWATHTAKWVRENKVGAEGVDREINHVRPKRSNKSSWQKPAAAAGKKILLLWLGRTSGSSL